MSDENVKISMSTDLVTVTINQSLEEAAGLMERSGIRHLPVRNDFGVVVGILSTHDIHRAKSPSQMRPAGTGNVSDFMSWPVITVEQSLPLREAALGMIQNKVSALLVTDSTKAVVGILTTEDLLKKLVSLLPVVSAFDKLALSPVVGELLREVQAVGI